MELTPHLKEPYSLNTFLLEISHELKTPLTPAMIQAEMLLGEDLGRMSRSQKESLTLILHNIRRINFWINELLYVSLFGSHQFYFLPRINSIEEVILGIIPNLEHEALHKGITISWHINADKGFFDYLGIQQVLSMLIRKAIRCMPPDCNGAISVHASREKRKVLISIINDGFVLNAGEVASVFNPLRKPVISASGERVNCFGLATCQGIIREHGAEIYAELDRKSNVVFHFTLPLQGRKGGRKKKE